MASLEAIQSDVINAKPVSIDEYILEAVSES